MKRSVIFAARFINGYQTQYYAQQMQMHRNAAKLQNTSGVAHKAQGEEKKTEIESGEFS